MNKLKIVLFILIFLPSLILSQSREDEILKGTDYVYHIKFDSANAIFQSSINKDPTDPTGYFFMAMSDWWKIYINKEDQSFDDEYFKMVEKCIDVCDKKIDHNENDDWAIFLKGGVIGYRGFLNSIRDNWLKAIDDGKTGLSLLQRSYELNPDNKDAIFGVGLYNYAEDYVTEKYPFLKALLFLFPKGNKELGLSQLKDCADNGKYSKTEAKFVLCYVNLNYEKNYQEAEKYSSILHEMYPENPIASKFLGKSFVGTNYKWNESLTIWKEIISKSDSGQIGFNNQYTKQESEYYIGLSLFRLNMLDDAIIHYEQALSISKELDKDNESAYQVFSALGLGMVYDAKNDRNNAVKYYKIVLDMKDIENSRESAQMFIDHGYH